jgi:hypothetical protein
MSIDTIEKRTKKNLKKRTKKKTLRRRRKTRKHRGGVLNRNSNKGIRKKHTQKEEDVYSMMEFKKGEKPKIVSDVTEKPPKEPVYASLDLKDPLYQNVPVNNQTQYATVVGTTQGPFKK